MSDEWHHPMQTGRPSIAKIDLGDGHWLEWSEWKGQICGGIITHTTTKTETGLCTGAFWIISDPQLHKAPIWQWDGNQVLPTLTPSFLCHCKDHGFIQNGKWIRA